ncbi:ABC transporter ATP-binding protein [Oceanicella sp. SM1341]|uniref:ABC transporter ATP-binding protein n=1 Tax=Oceanicella sp. SM1341 TaxID=1548889 RepID=UPI0018E51120|nr:ABC transporter ATP-binding protein [Oceanicella sp. SM1341]
MQHTPSVLSLSGVEIGFRTPRGLTPVVHGVSLEVAPGEIHAVVGESGSGKTMLARAAIGLLPPGGEVTAGTIAFDGRDLAAESEAAMRRIRGAQIGMIFQEPLVSLNPSMKIGAQMAEAARLHTKLSRREIRARALEMLHAVKIADPERCLECYPHEFSGGMRQRIMIASVMLLRPRLLLADEPTTALDAVVQREVLDIMTEMTRSLGVAVVLVTHDLGVVARYAQRMTVMERGHVVESGPTRSVLAAPREAYTRRLLGSLPVAPEGAHTLPQAGNDSPTGAHTLLPEGNVSPTGPHTLSASPEASHALPHAQTPSAEGQAPRGAQASGAAQPAPFAGRDTPEGAPGWPVAGRRGGADGLAEGPQASLAEPDVPRTVAPGSPAGGALAASPHGARGAADGPATELLRAEAVEVSYEAAAPLPFMARRVNRVVHGVSLSIRPGEMLGLVGESGSGKSTLGRALIRLKEVSGGRVLYRGQELSGVSGEALRRLRARMQIIFQDPYSSLNPRMRVGAIVAEGLRHAPPPDSAHPVEEMLEAVGLSAAYAARFPHEMSGGQRQRVAIARALISRPELVVADEPVSALDVTVQAQILDLLRELRGRMGFACLFISHDLAVVESLCDRVMVLYRGRVMEEGTARQLFEAPRHPYTRRLLAAAPFLEPTPAGGYALRVLDEARYPAPDPACYWPGEGEGRYELAADATAHAVAYRRRAG